LERQIDQYLRRVRHGSKITRSEVSRKEYGCSFCTFCIKCSRKKDGLWHITKFIRHALDCGCPYIVTPKAVSKFIKQRADTCCDVASSGRILKSMAYAPTYHAGHSMVKEEDKSFQLLHSFVDEFIRLNEGSKDDVVVDESNAFERAFFSPGICQAAFDNCKPMLRNVKYQLLPEGRSLTPSNNAKLQEIDDLSRYLQPYSLGEGNYAFRSSSKTVNLVQRTCTCGHFSFKN